MKTSKPTLEDTFAMQARVAGLPAYEREFRFAPERRWRFDFAWPSANVAVEVEGGTWSGGRHTRGAGYAADCEKYNEAAVRGWTVIRATGDMVRDGRALEFAERALRSGKALDHVLRPKGGLSGRTVEALEEVMAVAREQIESGAE